VGDPLRKALHDAYRRHVVRILADCAVQLVALVVDDRRESGGVGSGAICRWSPTLLIAWLPCRSDRHGVQRGNRGRGDPRERGTAGPYPTGSGAALAAPQARSALIVHLVIFSYADSTCE
jgi:hypothetical protein